MVINQTVVRCDVSVFVFSLSSLPLSSLLSQQRLKVALGWKQESFGQR